MLAYHFVGETLRDGRPVPAIGETLVHAGEIELCWLGFHASVHPFDALAYAPGNTLCLVEVGGMILQGSDKIVGSERTILDMFDATELLRKFARQQALTVIDNWNAPDVVRRYLETGDEKIRSAARSAARSASEYASESVAWYAAHSAAWYAIAYSAARYAAHSAAHSAAWSFAYSVAYSASESAAHSAAWYAAQYAARNMFLTMVEEGFNRGDRAKIS